MSYRQLHYTLRFLTPAFLGDAEQNGRWRTPPIKHLLREWWRVAYAADKNFNVNLDEMRREEGLLFGNAWLSHREGDREVTDHSKSLVRLRLSKWDKGTLRQDHWPGDALVIHPEVRDKKTEQTKRIGSALYLGYGPLTFDKGTALKAKCAVEANESATVCIAVPSENMPRVERALALADLYGTLGGRSRNGWGSFQLTPRDEGTPRLSATQLPLRPWRDCLSGEWDWPHAIGSDDRGPLIWQTAPHADWKSLMKTLAVVKIGLRTQFRFSHGGNAPSPECRHWLSYPVTNHSVRPWGNNARLPNTLRFKVRLTDDGRLVGVIFHVPHLPPNGFRPDRQAIEQVWAQVHRFLDQPAQRLKRIPT